MASNLLESASATGSPITIARGRYAFAVDGTFGGATVGLEMLSPDGVSYISVGTEAALTAEGAVLVELPTTRVRAAVAGGTPSALYASIEWVGR